MEECFKILCNGEMFDGCEKCDIFVCEKHFKKDFIQKDGSVFCFVCQQTITSKRSKKNRCIANTTTGHQCSRAAKIGLYCSQHSSSYQKPYRSDRNLVKCRICNSEIHGKGGVERAVKGTVGLIGGSFTGTVIGTIAFPGFGTLGGLVAGGLVGGHSGVKQIDDVCESCCGICEQRVCICNKIVGVCSKCRSTSVTFGDQGICSRCRMISDV